MKSTKLICLVLLSVSLNVNAQTGSFWSKTSLEAAYGYNLALTPNNVDRTEVSGLNTLQIGANYEIDDLWSVRGTYANTTFKHSDFSHLGITYNKLTAEAAFNVVEALNNSAYPSSNVLKVDAHAGLGLSIGKSKAKNSTDAMGNFQVGLKPQYNITNTVGIFIDATYIMNFSQDLGYNGLSLPNKEKTMGGYITGLAGVSIKLAR